MTKCSFKRIIAFIMAFIMAASVMFQSDYAYVRAFAGDAVGVSTPTDAEKEEGAALAETELTNLAEAGYYLNISDIYLTQVYNPTGRTTIPTRYISVTNGTKLAASCYTISYENNDKVGTATIIATGKESAGYTGEVRKNFTIKQRSISAANCFLLDGEVYTVSPYPELRYTAGDVMPEITVRTGSTSKIYLTQNLDYKVTYCNVDRAGEVDPGDVYGPFITVTSLSGSNYLVGDEGEMNLYFTIVEADIANEENVSVSLGEKYPYTGQAVTPEPTLIDLKSGSPLIKNYDYEITYSNNTDIGTATAVITGMSERYYGSITKTFSIVSADSVKSLTDAEISISGSFVYNGQAHEPVPVVTYNGSTLTNGTDFKVVSYSDNVNASTSSKKASVKITGLGSYVGTVDVPFTIQPKDIGNITYTATDAAYNPNNKNVMQSGTTVSVMDGTTPLTLSQDFYLDFTEFNNGKKYDVGTYSFDIKGTGNYTGTKAATFNIVPADIGTAVITVDPQDFTGLPLTPAPSKVTYNGATLTAGTDYEVYTYSNNTNIGANAVVTIRGLNNFTGTADGKFTIKTDKISMADVSIGSITGVVYTGSQLTPKATLTYQGTTLTEGTDYESSYGENLLPGTGTVTFTGKGDYAGSVDRKFTISAKNIGDDDVVCDYTQDYEYTGQTIVPVVKLTYNNMELIQGVDYKVTTSAVEAGENQIVWIDAISSLTQKYTGSRSIKINVVAPSGNIGDLPDPVIEDQYYTGSEIVPQFTLKNGDYVLKEGVDYTVTGSSNVNVGTAVLTITGLGTYEDGEKILTFKILPKPFEELEINYSQSVDYAMGQAVYPDVTIMNGSNVLEEGIDYEITYDNNVNASEEATFTITSLNDNYEGGPVTKTFTVSPLQIKQTQGFSITDIDDQQYTGSEIAPAVTIKKSYSGKTYILMQDVDYTVTFGDNNVEVGNEVNVTIEGIGNFAGTITKTFNIVKRELSSCVISSIPNQSFTGSAITPSITIKNGEETLEEGTDYTLKYSNNIEVGTATVYITGAGSNYTGTVTRSFSIVKESISLVGDDKLTVEGLEDQVYNFGNLITPEFTVKYDGIAMRHGSEYTYSFSNNKNVGTATLTISGCGKYSGSVAFYFDILAFDISGGVLELDTVSTEYTGGEITPQPLHILTDDIIRESSFEDFTVSYDSNVNVGTGSVTITAKTTGNYKGSLTQTFLITALDITGATVTADDAEYTGEEQTPAVTVTLKNGELLGEENYTVFYSDNVEIGTASITVEAKEDGNYKGTASGSFKITAIDISKAVIAAIEDQTYTGREICPAISVTYKDKQLEEDVDYVVSGYDSNVNAGADASVTITGKGLYGGTKSAGFTINPASVDTLRIMEIDDQVYTGYAVTPKVFVYNVDTLLTEGTDYTVSYENNIEVTTSESLAKATITGKGNYTGSVVKTFAIAKGIIDFSKATLSIVDEGPFVYQFGKNIEPEISVSLDGSVLPKECYTVTYSDNVDAGVATITAKGNDNYKGQVQTTFTIAKYSIASGSLVLDENSFVYTGSAIEPEVSSIVCNDNTIDVDSSFTVSYSDNVNKGTATVTVTANEASNFTGKISDTYTISAADISKAEITVANQVYSGVAVKPEPVVSVGGRTLTPVSDYLVTYENNIAAGTAQLTITGTGNYKGQAATSFRIARKDIAECDISDIEGQIWTGKEITPAVSVKLGNITLVNDVDYTVEYQDNVDVTENAKATITGIGNYTGTKVLNFSISRTIVSIKNAVVGTIPNATYAFGGELKPEITVTYGEDTLTEGVDYNVTYKNNVNAGTASVIITGTGFYNDTKTVSFVIDPADVSGGTLSIDSAKLVYNGTAQLPNVSSIVVGDNKVPEADRIYFDITGANNVNVGTATITATAKTGTNYQGSVSATFEIISQSLADAEMIVDDVVFQNKELTPGVTVTLGGKTLVYNKDYTTSYSNNTAVGEATVTIKGTGNYTGTASKSFNILPRSIESAAIEVADQVYTGSSITPDVVVTLGSEVLSEGTDYTVSYSDNIFAGTGTVTVTGKGNYKGGAAETFKIAKADISGGTVSKVSDQTYTGQPITPAVTVTLANGKLLTAETDYDVAYSNNINVTSLGKEATITITAKGNYTGQLKTTFVINPRSVSGITVNGYSDKVSYTGKEITFDSLSVLDGDEELVFGTDFTVTYYNNINVTKNDDTYFEIIGLGNYTGNRKYSFAIDSKSIADCDIKAIPSQIWTGREITPEVVINNGDITLTQGTDFDVTYENNIDETTELKQAKAIITGKGNYSGSVTKAFTISRILVDISNADISQIDDQTFDFGRALTPGIIVSYKGETLTQNVDYKLDYANNVNVGEATVTISGIGGYNKSVVRTFRILPADITGGSITLKGNSFPYTGSSIAPAVTRITVSTANGEEIITDLSSFDITYSDNVNAGTASVSVAAKSDTNYTGTAAATFEITKASIETANVEAQNGVYSGSEITPDVTVTLGEKTLIRDTDYTVTYSDNVAAGSSAKVIVTGAGNYSGTVNSTFEIAQRSISDGVCGIPSQVYTGSDITPEISLTVAGKKLAADVDYTVTYENNRNVSTDTALACAVLKGTGNYTGRLSVYFSITPKSLASSDVSDVPAYEYTGAPIMPEVVVTNGGAVLTEGRDYDVTYSDNVDKGASAKVIVTGKGNYQGTVTKLFEICMASISGAEVSNVPENAVYTGDSIVFDNISVVLNDKILSYGSDYTISYENNIDVTTDEKKAYVIIKGAGNYGGQIKKSFDIVPKDIALCKADDISGQIYTGSSVTPEVAVRDGSIVLSENEDYVVSYNNNVDITKNAQAIITGMGNYTGQIVVTFSISKEVLDISDAVIGAVADEYFNFGEAVTPDITVTLGGKTLEKGVDYGVLYTDNIKPGTATITVTGIDQNKGSVSTTFNILPIDIKNAVITLKKQEYVYTSAAVEAELSGITVTRNGVDKLVTDFSAFDISFSNNTNVGEALVTVAAKDGQGYTGSASASYSIVAGTIKDAEVVIDSEVYTGEAVIPVSHVTLAGKILTNGVDYVISCTNNIDASDKAAYTITGVGNYTGTLSGYFTIASKKLNRADIVVDSGVFTGSAVTPELAVTLDGKTLTKDVDYTAAYSDNINVTSGTAKAVVVITGIGNYSGTAETVFDILPMDIEQLDIADIEPLGYTGSPARPEIVMTHGSVRLVAGTDYSVDYQDNMAVTKNARAVITGKGNYTGSVSKTFEIKACSIESAEVSGIADTVVYSGDDIVFEGIKVTINGRLLENNTDYSVSYINNRNVTTDSNPAVCTITGKGNYVGEVSRSFTITAKNIARCSIDPVGGQIYTGSPITPEVVIRDGDKVLKENVDYTVSYGNNVDITENAEISIKGIGNYKGTAAAVFTIAKQIIDISKASISKPDDQYYDFGNEIRPEVTLTYGGKTLVADVDYELVYISNISEGTATIQANGINTNTGSVSTTFKILPIDIKGGDVTLSYDSVEYTGSALKPEVIMLTVSREGKQETVTSLGAFDITYSDNTNVGTATVTVTAKTGSGFTGSTSKTFTIEKVDISGAIISVDGSYTYTGSAIVPKYTVSLGGKVLVKDKDYTESCSNNVAAGSSAMVTVTGTGNYKGMCAANFTIAPKNIKTITAKVEEVTYSGEALTPEITVTLDDEILNPQIDYTVTYSNNVNATSQDERAVAQITGVGNFEGTVTVLFEIKARDISAAIVGDIPAQKYTGKEITPSVSVSLDGKELVYGTDYTVSYEDNIAVSSSAKAVIIGKGNYTGSCTKTFEINNISIEAATVTGIPVSAVYTGKEITFDDIIVTFDGKTLSEDVDYEVRYKDNIDVTDRAMVIITAKGNYSGKLERTFSITAKEISACSVDAIEGQIYTGSEIKPAVTVRDGGKLLVSGTDYTVSYSNNINVTSGDSKAVVTIEGTGNYKGQTSVTFAISKTVNDITKAVISKIPDQYFNMDQPLTPDFTVTLDGQELVKDQDYSVVYVNNVDEGEATVIVKGINNNTGSVSGKFNIVPVDISDGIITLDAASYVYTGMAVKPEITSFVVKRLGKNVKVTAFDNLEITYTSNTDVGTGKVTISAIEKEGFVGSVSRTFEIVGLSVENATVNVENGTYTGSAVTPSYTVELGGRTLVCGVDYEAAFSNNVNASDSAVLTITGKGNYSGMNSVRFTINPRKLTDAIVETAAARYTGKAVTPAFTVTVGSRILVEDTDFTAEYSDNVNVTSQSSKAYVTITGKGNYTGTATESFDILPRDISLAEIKEIERQQYTGNPVTPAITVADGDITLVSGVDYTVSYRNNIESGEEAEVVVTGKGNYTGTISRMFAIGGADISDAVVSGIKDSVSYTGTNIVFAGLKVTYKTELLTAGKDYTVSYSNNINVTDKAVITITGQGNYSGTLVRYFAITRKNIADSDCHVGEIGGQVYTGSEITPEVIVTYNNVTLTEDVDYEISYSNNIAPTTTTPAKAVITGKGSYTGTVVREFSITKDPVNISGAKVQAIADQEFARQYITPEVTITYNSEELVLGTDYKISYSNNFNVGTATVYITGYGNYVGSKKITFNITKRDISDFKAEISGTVYSYTGKAITPAVSSVENTGISYALDEDEINELIVKYTDNINVGKAKVTLTAAGTSNYTGSITSEFDISPLNIEGATVTADTMEYTGSAVTPKAVVMMNGLVLSENDYEVTCSNNIYVGKGRIQITGKGNYTGTVAGTFDITARSIKNCTVTVGAVAENNSGVIVPSVSVKNGDVLLVEGKDYTVSCEQTGDATSKAKVVITGRGNYKDSVTNYVSIAKLSLTDAVLLGVEDKVYTGTNVTQNVTVLLGEKQLTLGEDYSIRYINNLHVGTATVIITGIGNYTDSIRKNFVISRRDISKEADITGIRAEVTYTGRAFKFTNMKITWAGTVLKEGVDYTVSYKNNSGITLTRTSKASFTVTFLKDFKGRITQQFRIKAFDISEATVTPISDKTYTGSAIKPAVKVTIDNTVIDPEEYEVVYSSNKYPGIATVKITGLNNFYGTKTVTFNILPSKVSGLKFVKSTTSAVKVSWSAVKYAQGYEVYYSKDGKTYTKAGGTTQLTYTLSKLASGRNYYIAVKAYVKASNTKLLYSASKATLLTGTHPAKVTGITYSSRNATVINAKWNKVSGASGYKVYRTDNAGKKYVEVGKTASNSIKISGLKASTAYKIKVVAYRYVGKTVLWSAENAAKIMTTPTAVTGLTASKNSTTSIKLSWRKVSSADGYMVYRKSGTTYKKIGTIKSNATTSFVSSRLTSGTAYSYKVTAYKKFGTVVVQNAGAKLSTVTLPATPVVAVKAGASKLITAWNPVKGADGYVIYMSTSRTTGFKKIAAVKSTAKSQYTKTGLVKGKTYYIKLRAYKKTASGKLFYSSYSTVRYAKVQ